MALADSAARLVGSWAARGIVAMRLNTFEVMLYALPLHAREDLRRLLAGEALEGRGGSY